MSTLQSQHPIYCFYKVAQVHFETVSVLGAGGFQRFIWRFIRTFVGHFYNMFHNPVSAQ